MSQYARPDSDIAVGNWASAPLYTKIDEVTPNDADYIYPTDIPLTMCRIGLSNVDDPIIHTGHIVRHRAKYLDSNPDTYTVSLYQGTTLIASWDRAASLISSYQTFEETLTEGQAATITDYTVLELRFTAYNSPEYYYPFVSWAELEVPNITNIKVDDQNFIFWGIVGIDDELDFILKGKPYDELDFILKGKPYDELDFILQGISHLGNIQNFILRGVVGVDDELDFILAGKPYDEQAFILQSKNQDELGFILKTIDEATKKRLALFDILNLRTTAVYRAPRNISYLKLIYGDFSNSRIPCTPLDKDGYMHHASDIPMQIISKVFIDGEPNIFGFKAYTAYQDETGHSIACVIFDNPQYDKKISISGKGAMNLDTSAGSAGELIENPADLIKDVLLNIQDCDASSIDLAEISRFYSDCLTEEIKIACIIIEPVSIKTFFDELAMNIHAHWMISDGKSVMRLRWL